jgi:hypothetical protein
LIYNKIKNKNILKLKVKNCLPAESKFFLTTLFLILLCLLSAFLPALIFPEKVFCEEWLKVEAPKSDLVWIDTSHWKQESIYVKDGYYRDITGKRWVDTSYVVSQGYWKTGQYRVWVVENKIVSYTSYRYIDTSHWETKYRDVEVFTPVNFVIFEGTNSYGWSIYAFAAQPKGLRQVTYNGEKYMAEMWVIDYKPYRGGWIHAVKWVFRYKFTKQRQYYSQWVQSGYWQSYTHYEVVDTSHWETRTGRHWVDTSYTVSQGYWEEYAGREWVDTSYYEFRNVWVNEGYYVSVSVIHGKVVVEKNPKYVFTRWHKDGAGSDCSMELKISWEIDNSLIKEGEEAKKIARAYIYEEVVRYKNKGIDKVEIFNGAVNESSSGSIETFTKFNFAGSEDSILHIYLFSQDDQTVHIYFNNPVNGFRSINIDYDGTNTNADKWLGGNNYGEVSF